MVPLPDVLHKLLAHSTPPDIVQACCWSRSAPHVPMFDALPECQLSQSAAHSERSRGRASAASSRRRVFEAMPVPWFEHTTPGVGEDLLLCEKARGLGVRRPRAGRRARARAGDQRELSSHLAVIAGWRRCGRALRAADGGARQQSPAAFAKPSWRRVSHVRRTNCCAGMLTQPKCGASHYRNKLYAV